MLSGLHLKSSSFNHKPKDGEAGSSLIMFYISPALQNTVIDLPVTLLNSSTICSLVLLLGIEPTKSLLLATEMHTPMCFPERISWLLY